MRPDNGNTVAAGFYGNDRNDSFFGNTTEIVNGVYYIAVEKGTNKVVNKFMTEVLGE